MVGSERNLHIGGKTKVSGWEIFDAIDDHYVDHVGDAKDLSRFADETFAVVYASHVLEHFDHKVEVKEVLQEWKRVLKKDGKLYISVPNLDVLAMLFLAKKQLSIAERYDIVCMIYGGHISLYDYHKAGFDRDLLFRYLTEVGFDRFTVVDEFGLFSDHSSTKVKGVPISINVIAVKN